jgi:16S rRNA (cytosine967-C5)-methyltransferase
MTLAKQAVTLSAGALLSSARIVDAGDVTNSEAFVNGEVVIQDEGSQLVVALVGASLASASNDPLRILDCCAAPGGKTLALADRNPAAQVTAVDVHPHRARLLRRLLQQKSSAARIAVLAADATQLPFSFSFDRVLTDVPCSGTGTLARNPEIKWRLDPTDLADLQKRQVAILRSALMQATAGGRVVYSTCSLEQEENEDVIAAALAATNSFRVLDCREELERLRTSGELLWQDVASLCRGPFLRTIPGIHPCDGFFAAVLQKV